MRNQLAKDKFIERFEIKWKSKKIGKVYSNKITVNRKYRVK